MFLSRALAASISLLCCGLAAAGTPEPGKGEAIDQIIRQFRTGAGGFSGAVLVADHGAVVLKAGYGLADREWEVPNAPDTRFQLASMTKTFTAVLVLQLREEGKLDLEDTLKARLPSYPAAYAERVTVRDLLTHRSGIPHYTELPGWFEGRYRAPIGREAFLETIAELPLAFEPGTEYRYSNSNFHLLAHIIERITGGSYETALERRILDPLGMDDTGCLEPSRIIRRLARDYLPTADGGYVKSDYVDLSLFTGTASLYSTVEDLFRWSRAFVGDALLSEASRKLMFDPEQPIGWVVDTLAVVDGEAPVDITGYNGELNGFNSMMTRFPGRDAVILLLSNAGTGFEAMLELTTEIGRVLHSPPE